ncbi:MAG: hypothetical protein V4563_17165 [Pseudomonadota bacterium]
MAINLARMGSIPRDNTDFYGQAVKREDESRAAADARKAAALALSKGQIDLAKAALDQKELERNTREAEQGRGIRSNYIINREGAQDLPVGVRSPEFLDMARPSNAPFGPMNAPVQRSPMETKSIIDLARVNPDMAEQFRTGNITERQGQEDRTRKMAGEDQKQIQESAKFGYDKQKDASTLALDTRKQDEAERDNRVKNNIAWVLANAAKSKADAATPEIPTTKGEQAYDRYAAKDLAEWDLGGSTEVDKNLKQLETAVNGIYPVNPQTGKRQAVEGISGKVVGRLPDWARSTESINARDQITEVAQRNLRQVLGAQYTEKEGVALIRRAYNETLPVETNVIRLNNLIKQIKAAKEAKDAASQYFKQYGTLKGFNTKLLKTGASDFNPEVPTFDSDAEADAAGLAPGTKVIVGGREGVWNP